ncbi:NAD(P)/FAD-dependent oxidoreductase [Octadecabacter ascidiaceicola]|uniref:Monomeric sarcosine oxidase n=1 Tax=Octadecabacter ascidiaceicola TaxID=1655543 RepID=A0A238K7K4_9RHOB|nr:FAD-binding oxidoreductase [Octadecabacter ascidiaceicola]SMX38072.1 Monomeric sarcosine oxidase [Octadecabacter ascidiaceicola]
MVEFPISDATPIEHGGALPESVDVVIIGGGIVGVSAAIYLNRLGQRVVLLEKGRIAGEQSSRNWGWIRQQGRDPDELPIMVEARRLWQELSAQTGDTIGLVQGGITYMAKDQVEYEKFASWMPHAKANGVDSRMLSRAELANLLPEARSDWAGGIYTASDMRAEPWVAVPTLARLAVSEGVTIIEGCAARGVETSAGQITAVVSEQGTVRTPQVVIAGGAWSSLFLRNAGVNIPQLSVRASVVAVDGAPMTYQGGGADSQIAFRTRADGGFTLAAGEFHEFFLGPDAFRAFGKYLTQIKSDPFGTRYYPAAPKGYPDAWRTPRRWALDEQSPFERMRVLNPKPNAAKCKALVSGFSAQFPKLGPIKVKAAWAGMIDSMPDLVPVVDRVEDISGLTIATGMSGHGFGIGPAIGYMLADTMTGKTAAYDLNRFRLSRFSDGSKMVLGPAI